VQGLIDGINSLIGSIPDLTPGFDIPGVPFLQRGAFNIPRSTLAVLHQGEMVVPATFAQELRRILSPSLLQPAFAGAGGSAVNIGSINIEVNGSNLSPQQVQTATRDGVVDALRSRGLVV